MNVDRYRIGLINSVVCGLVIVGGTAACAGNVGRVDPSPTCVRTVDVGNATQTEGDPAAGVVTTKEFQFAVTSTGCAAGGTLWFSTSADTAIMKLDYEVTEGPLTFDAKDMAQKNITVHVVQDDIAEVDEWLRVVLCPPKTGLPIGLKIGTSGLATIVDDDGPVSAGPAPSATPSSNAVYKPDGYGCGR